MPERIKVDNIIYIYEHWEHFYYTDNEAREDLLVRGKDYSTNDFLNWNVELIEEQQDIDIQAIKELDEEVAYTNLDLATSWSASENKIVKQQNQILKYLKQLDRNIREER